MAKQVKEEYKIFMKDIEKNLKSKEDIDYLKKEFPKLMNQMLNKLDNMESNIKEKEQKMQQMEEKQNELESKINKMQNILDNIENDIYADEGFDFEIVCPYCNNNFVIDVDENKTEIQCPECSNIIELDWSGDPEWDLEDGCNGGCSHCSGCEEDEDDDM